MQLGAIEALAVPNAARPKTDVAYRQRSPLTPLEPQRTNMAGATVSQELEAACERHVEVRHGALETTFCSLAEFECAIARLRTVSGLPTTRLRYPGDDQGRGNGRAPVVEI